METPTKSKLASKLAKILGEIGKVAKTGHNAFHKYDYVTENDLVYAVRDKLSSAGIFVFSSTESQAFEIIESGDGKKSILTTVCTKHTFMDGESGESFSVMSQGQGSDAGDKGGYKAITGAMKYFLYKCFMIPTGDDPEADTHTDERAAGGVSSSASSKPASSAATQRPVAGKSTGSAEWMSAIVPPFIKKAAGMTLAEAVKADPGNVQWWAANYQPKPFNGRISPKDVLFQTHLKQAAASISGPAPSKQEEAPPDGPQEDVPF